MPPILYSFRRCPYAIRARLAIQSANMHVELREIVLKNKPVELLQASPKGTVPVLVLPDGQVIDESRDIMLWALNQSDPQGWLTDSIDQANTLVSTCDFEFKPNLDGYKYADRYPESAEFYRQQADGFLRLLDERLAQHAYLLSNQISLADMAVFPFVRQFAHVDLDYFNEAGYAKLQQWLNGFLNADWFSRVMTKYPAWRSADVAVYFP